MEDLIASKVASGRPQDLADADAIRKATESQRPKAAKKSHPKGRPETALITRALYQNSPRLPVGK